MLLRVFQNRTRRGFFMLPKKNLAGPWIAVARKTHRPLITQAELANRARAAGVPLDRAAIAKIEGGFRGVLDYELGAMARILGKSPRWFLRPPPRKRPGQ